MSHTITIGPAIRAIRKAQGVSQLDLAGKAGVSGPYLTNIEGGVKKPSFDTSLRIAHALGVRPEAITATLVCPTCDGCKEAA